MTYMAYAVIFISGYYSYSYGKYLLKKEKNKLAAFGVMLISLLSILVPIITLYMRM